MHLGLPSLLSFYEDHAADDHLVLAVVTGIEGSSYRKPGALMLIDGDGRFQGMISGGCLEQDLALRARQVFESGKPLNFTYDLRSEDEQPWGLGLGCSGVIHLLLRRLDREAGFGFLPALQQALADGRPSLLTLVTDSDSSRVPVGAYVFRTGPDARHTDSPVLGELLPREPLWTERGRAMADSAQAADGSLDLLHIRIDPSPRVLICGGGADAVPLAAQVRALGWRCTVIDHRPAYADPDRFTEGVEVLAARPDALGDHVVLRHFSAAMIMSHHLDHDATYLEQVLAAGLKYVGLLGPSDRRARLLERIGRPDARVHGPAGLDIGAELPESIALSIMAEIHAVLNGRQGQSLAHG